jgi:hypothetical protein
VVEAGTLNKRKVRYLCKEYPSTAEYINSSIIYGVEKGYEGVGIGFEYRWERDIACRIIKALGYQFQYIQGYSHGLCRMSYSFFVLFKEED